MRARSDNVGYVHCISTVHSCDVRRVLHGNIMNSFSPITARAFLLTFNKKIYKILAPKIQFQRTIYSKTILGDLLNYLPDS